MLDANDDNDDSNDIILKKKVEYLDGELEETQEE